MKSWEKLNCWGLRPLQSKRLNQLRKQVQAFLSAALQTLFEFILQEHRLDRS